jgi:plasmid stability protein
MYSKRSQYTIRNVPQYVDRALRQRAKQAGKSFNQVVVEALGKGAGAHRPVFDDLDFMIGSMSKGDAKALEREVVEQRRIDRKLWL